MLYVLGVLVAIGAGVLFGVLGVLAVWGGMNTLRTEVARDYLRTAASGGARATTSLLVGLPVIVVGLFGLLALVRCFQMVIGG